MTDKYDHSVSLDTTKFGALDEFERKIAEVNVNDPSIPILWGHRPSEMRPATVEETRAMEKLLGHEIKNLQVPISRTITDDLVACAEKFQPTDNPWMPVLLNHDVSGNPIGLMRQVGDRLQVDLGEPVSRDDVVKIFGGAGIWILEQDAVGRLKRFEIVEFSLCSDAAPPSPWLPIETAPKSSRALVRGGIRNVVDGYHDVQTAWIDSCGNVWADDRKEGAAPIEPTHWMQLQK